MWLVSVVLCALYGGGAYAVDLQFPSGFQFGAATASYQIEGAWNVSDKSESIWDKYTHERPTDIRDGSNGDVACDSYHLWETDIEIAANLSLHFYRFSLAWTRLLPNGFATHVSEDGKNYYNKLIDGLLAKGIEPVVTLYHWDLPQRLQTLGGWTNPYMVDWFADYADVVFSLFGDRVKIWITLNEPLTFCDAAMTSHLLNMAPGIKDEEIGIFLCNKIAMLAHGKAYRLYHDKYGKKFNGKVSIANQIIWYEGLTESDEESGELAMDYMAGRYSTPIYSKEGGWPPAIEKIMAEKSKEEGYSSSRLPAFTKEELELVRGTYDFFALNHYSSRAARKAEPGEFVGTFPLYGVPELGIVLLGRPEWKQAPNVWLLHNPDGIRKVMNWIKKKYGDIPIMITENGYSSHGSNLEDDERVLYYRDYMKNVLLAIQEDKVNVTGYTAWTLIDNYEWWDGYSTKFGLYEVNFTDPMRTRTPRKSALFYRDVIRQNSLAAADNYIDPSATAWDIQDKK